MIFRLSIQRNLLLIYSCILIPVYLSAQSLQILESGKDISLRGLSVVNDAVFWSSGTKGTVVRSINNGKTIEWISVVGYEDRDFRDIEAFDNNTAIIMAIDTPAVILKTADGGKSWSKVWEDKRPGMFLDALYFANTKEGIVVGDPVDGQFFLATTADEGNHWKEIKPNRLAKAQVGEVLFAASGSNIILHKSKPVYVTGGTHSHLIIGTKKNPLPVNKPQPSAGMNALALSSDGRIIMVGGDYLKDHLSKDNCFLTDDWGKTWIYPAAAPNGYKSSVAWLSEKKWISCGTSGVDISINHGMTWETISNQSFNVVQKAKNGNQIILVGKNGFIARYAE
ncbi:MAG: oxidoreductase [Bacteroidetes bacterium]|nr:oxidoreductase [Bacteroidota bacterium]